MDDPRPITVDPTAAGMRADVYLAHRFALYSRSGAAEAIRSGEVVSTSRTLKPASLLKAGEVLHLHSLKLAPQGEKPPCPPVLHEDDHVLAFNKPAGMLCHPVGQAFAWGVINLARERYPGESLHLAHRLDRETSGVLLLARSDAANRHLKACFKARSVEKTYLAVVRGQVAQATMMTICTSRLCNPARRSRRANPTRTRPGSSARSMRASARSHTRPGT